VGFRRAVMRLLGRPVGLSGSGPTLWVLYPSLEEAQAAARTIDEGTAAGRLGGSTGRPPPFVAATTIEAAGAAPEPAEPVAAGETRRTNA
jgi:4-diphosphocytidyl-2C-methyl-D-erythritol kinase